MPIFNEERYVVEALESLTAQTQERLRILVIENRSTDRSHELACAIARRDARVTVELTPRRLTMAENWAFAFRRARQIYPEVPYFAWAGGHDRWDRRWLDTLAGELDERPDLVGAFSRGLEIDADGRALRPVLSRGDTAGIARARDRAATRLPGAAIYALFRPECLERTGLPRRVLLPDLLLLAEVAALGPVKEVPETLWHARATAPPSVRARERQRGTLFGGRVPVHARLPWPLVHAGVLLWAVAIRGNGVVPREEGVRVAFAHLRMFGYAIAPEWRRRPARIRWTLRRRRWALRRMLRKRGRALRNRGRALLNRARTLRRRGHKRLRRVRRRLAKRIWRARRLISSTNAP